MTDNATNWWDDGGYAGDLSPSLRELIAAENVSPRILSWQNHLIPGLLQHPRYMAQLAPPTAGYTADEVDRHVRVRSRRQQILFRPQPPTYHVVIDEAALRRQLGGPTLMGEQLGALLNWAVRPHITIQVLPLTGPPYIFGTESYVLLERPDEPALVYGGWPGNTADRVRNSFTELTELALPPAESADLIGEIQAEWHDRQVG